jgi:hypothetical protein
MGTCEGNHDSNSCCISKSAVALHRHIAKGVVVALQ